MIAIFRKTLLIIMSVFCATYIWLGFSFTGDDYEFIFETPLQGETHSFPISTVREERNPTPSPIQATIQAVPLKSNYILSVPKLNVQAPIIFEPTTVESRIYSALEKGVVHYADTPMPGQQGTSIIIGHSSAYYWYKGNYGSVFSKLSKLTEGDLIKIEKNGEVLNYRVSRSIIFSPESADDYALRELESTDESALVLMTCWPTGSNSKRVALKADLII